MNQSTVSALKVLLLVSLLPLTFGAPIYSPTCGTGSSNIPDATIDGSGATIPGQFSCGVVINLPGSVSAGNAVTVGLIGFSHEAIGDLIVTLTHYTDTTKTATYGATQTLFYQVGKISNDPNDFGYGARFGDLFTADNYSFNSGFSSNLWTIASTLGTADLIPGASTGLGNYTTHGPLSAAVNNFSAMFVGQPLGGYWQLDITDNAAGPSDPAVPGSLLQFSLDIATTTVPEPGSSGLALLGLIGLALWKR